MSKQQLHYIISRLEYLMTHNKNLTKKQYYFIDEVYEVIYKEYIKKGDENIWMYM